MGPIFEDDLREELYGPSLLDEGSGRSDVEQWPDDYDDDWEAHDA